MLDFLDLSHLMTHFRNVHMLMMVVSVIMNDSSDASLMVTVPVLIAAF